MMKQLFILTSVLFLVCGVTACGKLNTRIDETIEEVGTELTEVPVDVEKVRIKFGGASGAISGLTVANPAGYLTMNAFDMDLLRMNIGLMKSLGGPPIVLDELVIDSPVLILEFNDEGGSNLSEILENVKDNIKRTEDSVEQTPPAADEADKKPVRISVRRLVIEGVSFYVRRSDGTFRSGTLPTIELADVGGDEGKSPAGLGAVVVIAMAGEILKQAVAHRLADGFRFEPDKLLAYLEERLSLSEEQSAEMKVVAEKITGALNTVLETWVEEGFVDLASLTRSLAPVADEVRDVLQDVLDSEQMQEFEVFLANLDEEALEAVRNSLVERLAAALGLREEQVGKLKPILRRHVEQLGLLLGRFVKGSDRSFEDFKVEYDALRATTHNKLKDVLDPEQMDDLTRHQEEISERIRSLMF